MSIMPGMRGIAAKAFELSAQYPKTAAALSAGIGFTSYDIATGKNPVVAVAKGVVLAGAAAIYTGWASDRTPAEDSILFSIAQKIRGPKAPGP